MRRVDGPVIGEDGIARCPWAGGPGVMRDYHDTEWGLPVSGDDAVFERMTLEAFQSGLSWSTILNKRSNFRAAFDGFHIETVASYDVEKRAELMADAGIVRNRLKIDATIQNARAALETPLEEFVWSFRPERTGAPRHLGESPTTSPESLAMSKALKKKGFTFVGPTTMHALMEAIGIIDNHLVGCHRRGASGVWA
jgi:DNA-3-methyladenine glycosylase I